jgi:hypothetical protein
MYQYLLEIRTLCQLLLSSLTKDPAYANACACTLETKQTSAQSRVRTATWKKNRNQTNAESGVPEAGGKKMSK